MPAIGPSPGDLLVHLPSKVEDTSALSRWAPGFFTVALVQTKPGLPAMASNEVAFALAPQITVSPASAPAGTVNLTVTCEPRVVTGQRVLLVFGDRQAEPDSITNPGDPTQPTSLAFTIPGVGAGSYVVRLRVDGVDSIPVVAGRDAADAVVRSVAAGDRVMSDMERWLEDNDQFLAAAVAWVRARLEQAAGAHRPVAALPPAEREAPPPPSSPQRRAGRSSAGSFAPSRFAPSRAGPSP